MGEDGFLTDEVVDGIIQEMVDMGFDPEKNRVVVNRDPDKYEQLYAGLGKSGNIILNMQGLYDKPLDETTVRESAYHEILHYLNYGDDRKMSKDELKTLMKAPRGGKWIDPNRPKWEQEEKVADNFGYWAGRRGMAAYGLPNNTMLKPKDHYRINNPNISDFELRQRLRDHRGWNRVIEKEYDELTPELMDQYEIFQRILEGGYK